MYVPISRGYISSNTHKNVVGTMSGGSVKEIVNKRHQEEEDPNIELLKESLHRLSLQGQSRMNRGRPKREGRGMEKKSKYITF